jgi:hypothetical protein
VSVDPQTGHVIKLKLVNLQYDDAFMERTPVLTRLEHLTLQGTKVTAAGLRQISKLPSLKSLTIIGPPRFGVDDLPAAVAGLPNLRYVEIHNWGSATHDMARLNAAAPNVTWVIDPLPDPLGR